MPACRSYAWHCTTAPLSSPTSFSPQNARSFCATGSSRWKASESAPSLFSRLSCRRAPPAPLKLLPRPASLQTHAQVALQHNVCIVRLPSAVHVVALHTLRILQVRVRCALKYECLLVALICSHCQLRKWMAGVAAPPYALFHRCPSGWALYLPIATRMYLFLMSTSSWCAHLFHSRGFSLARSLMSYSQAVACFKAHNNGIAALQLSHDGRFANISETFLFALIPHILIAAVSCSLPV